MEQKFLKCEHCGNIVAVVKDSKVPVVCCGQKMTHLVPGAVEASVEKHLPTYKFNGETLEVSVGSILHPMEEKHYITFISLVTDDKVIRVDLKPGVEPVVRLPYVQNADIYEYCNLHGLWKSTVE